MLPPYYQNWMNDYLSTSNARQYNYIIARGKNGQRYYYKDFDEYEGYTKESLTQLIWTPHERYAFLFHSEQDVEEFKAFYVSPRKASIIRMIKAPVSFFELTG